MIALGVDLEARQASRQPLADLDTLDRRLGRPTQFERACMTLRRWDQRDRDARQAWALEAERREEHGRLVNMWGQATRTLYHWLARLEDAAETAT